MTFKFAIVAAFAFFSATGVVAESERKMLANKISTTLKGYGATDHAVRGRVNRCVFHLSKYRDHGDGVKFHGGFQVNLRKVRLGMTKGMAGTAEADAELAKLHPEFDGGLEQIAPGVQVYLKGRPGMGTRLGFVSVRGKKLTQVQNARREVAKERLENGTGKLSHLRDGVQVVISKVEEGFFIFKGTRGIKTAKAVQPLLLEYQNKYCLARS